MPYRENNKEELESFINNTNWKYCEKCNDYYLSKSFMFEREIINKQIKTRSEVLNNNYKYINRNFEIIRKICPKGHITILSERQL
jgi:hypothetical protein